jgi:hypothetical protein
MTSYPTPEPGRRAGANSFTRTWSTARCGGFAAPALCGLTN